MFICPLCKQKMMLPQCDSCSHIVEKQDNIWQLTQMPDLVTDGDGDKYIGYEYIGEHYSGNRKYLIEPKDYIFAKEISEITGNGIFFDLGCGELCDRLFGSKTTKLIQRGNKYECSIQDGFLLRFLERGFSDQIDVPQHLHQIVISELMTALSKKYGHDFADTVYKGVEDDLFITIYRK